MPARARSRTLSDFAVAAPFAPSSLLKPRLGTTNNRPRKPCPTSGRIYSLVTVALGGDTGGGAFKIVRVVRLLRPLRTITHVQSLRVVVNAFIASFPAVLQVAKMRVHGSLLEPGAVEALASTTTRGLVGWSGGRSVARLVPFRLPTLSLAPILTDVLTLTAAVTCRRLPYFTFSSSHSSHVLCLSFTSARYVR